MTKQQLYQHFQDHMSGHGVRLTRQQSAEFFAELERKATTQLVDTGEFTVPGIAKLTVTDKAARTGRNPGTGEKIQIPAKRVVKARIPKRLKDVLLQPAA